MITTTSAYNALHKADSKTAAAADSHDAMTSDAEIMRQWRDDQFAALVLKIAGRQQH